MGYPNMLAGFNPNVGSTVPFELWAGESDLVTSQGTAGANIAQFQVICYDEAANLIPWPGHGATAGSGSLNLIGLPSDGDTFTVNGQTITFRTAPGNTNPEVAIGASPAAAAANLAAFVGGHEDVYAVVVGAVTNTGGGSNYQVPVTAADVDDAPVTLAKAGANLAVSGATTTPSTKAATKPCGFAAQPAVKGGPVAFYTGGVPNHAALGWPASCATLAQRKAAFARTNMTISSLL